MLSPENLKNLETKLHDKGITLYDLFQHKKTTFKDAKMLFSSLGEYLISKVKKAYPDL
jgi:hypothetical protein